MAPRRKALSTVDEVLLPIALPHQSGYPAVSRLHGIGHVANILITELQEMDGSESHYDAKFTVLAENVRHHIKNNCPLRVTICGFFKLIEQALHVFMVGRLLGAGKSAIFGCLSAAHSTRRSP
jgi:hypothetical protein